MNPLGSLNGCGERGCVSDGAIDRGFFAGVLKNYPYATAANRIAGTAGHAEGRRCLSWEGF